MVDVVRPLVVAVDDDPAVLSALTRLLSKEPYDFVTVADPDQALEIIRTREVSLLLADYRMPSVSGTGLLQVVKATSPATRRIMLTGYPQSAWVDRAREKKLMEAVFEKPWDNDELRREIRTRVAP